MGKNFVLGSYCRAIQELQHGSWIMEIRWNKPECPTSCTGNFRECLRTACKKSVHCKVHGYLWVIGLKQKERRVALSSGLCLESYKCMKFDLDTVQITSNLTFTCMCSQNPCECASHTRGCAYSAHEQKYYARSYTRANCECHARTYITSGSTIRVHTRLINHCTRTRTHTLLASTRMLLTSAALTAREHLSHLCELSVSKR